ncbi:colicin E3/pyocin S6 family cytotoxin [Nocardia miyunensis]|uniref:colicin E3/pyocin S6 family cytotoxin n=1 Tax=Nocardia miyunensis TaxID=282684 RepID=UPI000AF8D6FE|nr:colicin E3/pyocin S6 family cytotoxin [Nocardia miyunensis]
MSPPVDVSPDALTSAGSSLNTVSSGVSTQLTALQTSLSTCGGMCGNDPSGVVLAKSVNKTTNALMLALTNIVNGTARIGDAVKACGANHGNANAASDMGTSESCPIPFPAETPQIQVKYPPSSEGGVGESIFARTAELLAGMVCPNGDQSKLRTAATAWRSMGATCSSNSASLGAPKANVAAQNIPEGGDICDSITSIAAWLTNTASSCTNLAAQLEQHAQHLDDVDEALAQLTAKVTHPSSLISGVIHLIEGDHSGVADEIRTILDNFGSEADALGSIIASEAEKVEKIASDAARYVGIVLYNVAAELVNVVASYGNAIQHDPLRMGTDIATTVAGFALTTLGGGGEILGTGLDATGLGAALGVPTNIASAGVIAAGVGLAAGGITDSARDVQGNMVSPMARKSPGGRGPVERKPAPKALKAFPDAKKVDMKTPVQGGGKLRPRWKDPKGRIYEWDYQHKTVEMYSKNGKHLGEYDPDTGVQTKPADKTRKVEP